MAEVDLNLKSSLEQLPSNSDKTKNKEEKHEEIKLDKVVTGNVTVKKRGFFKRFKKSMVSEDAENVGGYVFHDIIVPTIKDLIFDAARGALEMVLWGSTSGRRGRKGNVPYNSLNEKSTYQYNGRTNGSSREERKSRRNYNYFDISEMVFDRRSDAEDVLYQLRMVLEEYPSVSVANFYDVLDMSAPYTAENYGWTDLKDADVRKCKGGYYLDVPDPRVINK